MADLYQRKGGILSAPTINKPIENKNIVSSISSAYSQYLSKKANENFALGSRQLIDDVIKQSYEMNPTNAKQFIDSVESNILKISNDLQVPDEYKEKMLDVTNKLSKGYVAKINTNLEKQTEETNKQLVISNYDNNINGQTEFYTGMIDSLIAGDDKQYEAFNSSYRELKTYNDNLLKNARDKNGNQIVKKSNVKSLNIDKIDAFKDKIYRMDYEDLKKFDENTFQARERIKDRLDLTNDEYDDILKVIVKRRTELGEKEERITREQSYFDGVILAKTFNSEKGQELVKKGIISKDILKEFKEYAEIEINPVLMIDEDDSFITQLGDLQEVMLDDSNNPKETMEKGAKVLGKITKYIKENGTSSDIQQIITDSFINGMTNKTFAQDMSKMYDNNTALGQILSSKQVKVEDDSFWGAIKYMWKAPLKQGEIQDFKKGNEKAYKLAMKEAAQGVRQVLNLANMKLNPFINDEQKKQIDIEIDKTLEITNRNVIKSRYSNVFSRKDLDKAETDYNNGKVALLKEGNNIWEFQGYAGNDIILRRK